MTARPAPARRARGRAGESFILLLLDAGAIAAAAWSTHTPWAVTAAVPLTFAVAGLYRARLRFAVLDDLPRTVLAVAFTIAVIHWIQPLGRHGIAALGAEVGAALLARTVCYRILRWHRRRSPGRAAIVTGSGDLAVRLAESLRHDRGYGLAPVGFVGPATLSQPTLPVLASADDLERAVARYKPLHLIVAYPAVPDSELVPVLRRCRRLGVTVHVVPRLFELAVGSVGAELVNGIPLTRLRAEPVQLRRWPLKRLIDIVGAGLALILLAPVFLLCALAVKFESGRHGVLFRQQRVTRDGEAFTIVKFRSLTPADEGESQSTWSIDADARIGPVGRLLRGTSLDELPQLVNVLRGTMSLVGPRPERPYFVERFGHSYAGYPDRHRVPAGLTGWAQIHGLRGDTSIEDRVRYDNHYIENWSLGLDLKIMLRTLGTLIRGTRD
ncbi:sugar transferase [Actinoplanes sp. TFC3]|uniref:sugar transferase n=1 Tax=Actinoplanes sp. TFC3 TaxID=1710355 RepID=UPI00137B8AA7|nr:sugar transferase [Actinoplanes sp. TFC3]